MLFLCKNLLPILPSEEGWLGSCIYFYHSFWFVPAHLNGLLFCRSNFRAHDNDIVLATVPKSDTTWLKFILFGFSRRPTDEDSSQQTITCLCLAWNNRSPDFSSFTSPRIFASHMPYLLLSQGIRNSKCKIFYLCRNVKDNASLRHLTKIWPIDCYRGGTRQVPQGACSRSGPCWDHFLGYWMAGLELLERILFLKYEDLKERPVEMVKRLAVFIGCRIIEAEEAKEILRMWVLKA